LAEKLQKPRKIALGALAIFTLAAFDAWSLAAREGETVVTVKTSQTYQAIKGWEVTARFWEQDKRRDRYDATWLHYRDLILDHLVNELGVNRIRVEIRSGAENPMDYWTSFRQNEIGYEETKRHRYEKVNDNDDSNVMNIAGFQFSELDSQVQNVLLPMRRLIERNGERLFVNLCYVDFRGGEQGNFSHARQPAEFGELVIAAFDHLKRRFDLIPDAFEVVLEPDNTEHWGGREVGLGLVAAAKRLKQAGFAPEFIAPSTADPNAAPGYIDAMMAVPGVRDFVTTFSYHRYGRADTALPHIRQRARQFGKETAMLEHLTGGAEELHADLTEADASAWQQFGIASKDGPDTKGDRSFYYFVDIKDPDQPKIRMSKRAVALAQYFRFIRKGAIRMGAQSNRGGSKAVAFRNMNGTFVVVVNADSAGPISVRGLPSGAYVAQYTRADGNLRDLTVTRSADRAGITSTIPAPGVITFYQSLHEKSE
jgi:O-glycosyl hydrolase